MRPTAKINTKCLGWYYYDDSWHRVKGRVIGASKNVLVRGGGIAYMNSKVIIYTSRGNRTAYILKGAKMALCRKGKIALTGAKVGRLPKFKLGRLSSGYCKKVLAK